MHQQLATAIILIVVCAPLRASAQGAPVCTTSVENVWTPNPGGQGGYYRPVRTTTCSEPRSSGSSGSSTSGSSTSRPGVSRSTPRDALPARKDAAPPLDGDVIGAAPENVFGENLVTVFRNDSIQVSVARHPADPLPDGTMLLWEERRYGRQTPPASPGWCETCNQYTSSRKLVARRCGTTTMSGSYSDPYTSVTYRGYVDGSKGTAVSRPPWQSMSTVDSASTDAAIQRYVCDRARHAALPVAPAPRRGLTPIFTNANAAPPPRLPVERLPVVASRSATEEHRIVRASADSLADGSVLVWEQHVYRGARPTENTLCSRTTACTRDYDSEITLERRLCRPAGGRLGYHSGPLMGARYLGRALVWGRPSVHNRIDMPRLVAGGTQADSVHVAVCGQLAQRGAAPIPGMTLDLAR